MTADTLQIDIQQTTTSRLQQVDFSNLVFGRDISDHMYIAEYRDGQWQNMRIVPYGDLALSPATAALHYGQAIFEGMKAYKNDSGEVLLFRAIDNWKRLNKSAERMCMPTIPEEVFMNGLTELIKLDAGWVPNTPGCSLYIRPYMFATDPYIGVKPSESYYFIIFTSPVGTYYAKPPRVKIETRYIRAAEGGVGGTKCAGNYGGSLYPAKLAQQEGYDQLIWTDAREHAYIEESGTMNIMFMMDGKLVTPAVSETTLDGITRRSIIAVAKHWGIEVEERRVTVKEVVEALKNGTLESAFGAGTAVVISPFATIAYEGVDYALPEVTDESFVTKVKNFVTDIRVGNTPDIFGWTLKV
ncbi:branched-chain amino acid aminotransferase [Dyadobacter jejuensis]|uniref:branched-chain-amino-acid transaminase n=1 Tax=Dyadobacter jejuensis TaxID=1082580 RepID=A0A316APK6_9BACT|nr:branched-chain amino acid aminotransferase [Dyadobacter jejuensis]PWJ59522.1 branched-chain amino acid aminotransferase [Dyadobacter jejuensis]